MTARDEIFAALPRAASANPHADAAALLARVPALRPARVGPDPMASFLARLTGPVIAATAERLATRAEIPAAVRSYLAANQLAPRLALQPSAALQTLDWSGIAALPTIAVDEPVSVCEADYAVAETASLVFRSGPHMPTLFAFLPLHHIVVLEAAKILPWLEDAAALEATRPAPRNLNFVTGASGTTDIEGTLVRGAHGPAHLHVLLIGGQIAALAPQPANVP